MRKKRRRKRTRRKTGTRRKRRRRMRRRMRRKTRRKMIRRTIRKMIKRKRSHREYTFRYNMSIKNGKCIYRKRKSVSFTLTVYKVMLSSFQERNLDYGSSHRPVLQMADCHRRPSIL